VTVLGIDSWMRLLSTNVNRRFNYNAILYWFIYSFILCKSHINKYFI